MLFALYAFRNIFRHKTTLAVTLTTLVAGCTALVFAGGFFNDLLVKIRDLEIRSHTGHLQVQTANSDILLTNWQTLAADIGRFPEVQEVRPELQIQGLLGNGESSIPFSGIGADAQSLEGLSLTSGAGLTTGDATGMLLGTGLAAQMDVKPGATLTLLTRTIDDSVNGADVNVAGLVESGSKDLDDVFVNIPLATAQRLIRSEDVSRLRIILRDTKDTARVLSKIRTLPAFSNPDIRVLPWWELSDFHAKSAMMFNQWFGIVKLIIVLVSLLGIYNTMSMAVFERTAEIGTLQALGFRRSLTVTLFLWEGFWLGLVGASLGVLTGSVVTAIIGWFGIALPPLPSFTVGWTLTPRIVPRVLLETFFLILGTAVLASVIPAYQAARRSAAEALRYSL